jgi:DNA-binding MarR family transcriptional regulator
VEVNNSVDLLVSLSHTLRAIQVDATGDRGWLSLGLTMTQFKALVLVVSTGGLTNRDISERMRIGPSAVTPLVDRLVRQRLARRVRDPDDRRMIWIRPTAKAQALWEELLQASRPTLVDVLRTVPLQDLAPLQQSLAVLLDAARRVQERQQRPASV